MASLIPILKLHWWYHVLQRELGQVGLVSKPGRPPGPAPAILLAGLVFQARPGLNFDGPGGPVENTGGGMSWK